MKSVHNIEELTENTYVLNGVDGDYAVVKRCVHGHLYYACAADELPDGISIDVVAYDTDVDYAQCCG